MKTLFARCALPAASLIAVAAMAGEDTSSRQTGPSDYRIVELGGLGGTDSSGNSINNLGMATGYSHIGTDQHRHATLWLYGMAIDLGTLGDFDRNSNVPWPGKNNNGLIAGISQTNTPQPRGETWSCRSFFPNATRAGVTCLGFAYENGRMRPLKTFGGDNGFATGTNDRREIVGWAEKNIVDDTCIAPQVLRFRAAIWGPGRNQMRELKPLQDHRTSAATAINNRGQVVGISGACGTAVGSVSARNSVIWNHGGRPKKLPDFGGIAWNTPMAINDRGEVSGFANLSADDGASFNAQAFFVGRSGVIERIGVLEGHDVSQALGMNNHGQVVGVSCVADFTECRAFFWEKGRIYELNDFVPEDYENTLVSAGDINDDGHITGQALVSGTQTAVAFLALPTSRHHGADGSAPVAAAAKGMPRARAVLPAAVRQEVMARVFVNDEDLRPVRR